MRWVSLKSLLRLFLGTFLLVFLALPMGVLFIRAFQNPQGTLVGLDQFVRYFSSPHLMVALTNTLTIAFWSTLISVTLGLICAFGLERSRLPFKSVFRVVAMMPIFAPTMLLGICLIYVFGHQGLLTQLGFVIPLYGPVGIIIGEALFCFPVALMIFQVALSSEDYRLYEAAQVMDTSPLRQLMTITLPHIRYATLSAVVVCFTYSFTDFGAPSVVGGNYNVLATDVYKQVIGQQNFNMGAVVGILMLIPAVLAFFLNHRLTQKTSGNVSSRATAMRLHHNMPRDLAFTGVWLVVGAGMLLFFAMSTLASLVTFWPYNLTLTLDHYDFSRVAAGAGRFAILNSLWIAALTAALGTLLAYASAYAVEKMGKNSKSKTSLASHLIATLAMAPMAIPGTVMGLGYILFFNMPQFPIPFTSLAVVNGLNPLYGTMTLLVIVNIVHYFAVPFVTARTALQRLDPEFESVSDALGVPFYKTLIRVTIPMTLGAIAEMFVYFFINGMITVSAVVFLYSSAKPLVSVAILNVKDAGDIATAAALSMVLFGLNCAVRLLYEGFKTLSARRKPLDN